MPRSFLVRKKPSPPDIGCCRGRMDRRMGKRRRSEHVICHLTDLLERVRVDDEAYRCHVLIQRPRDVTYTGLKESVIKVVYEDIPIDYSLPNIASNAKITKFDNCRIAPKANTTTKTSDPNNTAPYYNTQVGANSTGTGYGVDETGSSYSAEVTTGTARKYVPEASGKQNPPLDGLLAPLADALVTNPHLVTTKCQQRDAGSSPPICGDPLTPIVTPLTTGDSALPPRYRYLAQVEMKQSRRRKFTSQSGEGATLAPIFRPFRSASEDERGGDEGEEAEEPIDYRKTRSRCTTNRDTVYRGGGVDTSTRTGNHAPVTPTLTPLRQRAATPLPEYAAAAADALSLRNTGSYVTPVLAFGAGATPQSNGETSSCPSSPETGNTDVVHQSKKTNPYRFSCSDCGKHYATSSNLSRHKQTHRSLDSESARQCPDCGKTYVSMPALSMHLLTHTLRHQCHVCSKAFSRPWLLQGHLRSHSGERPYGCAHCGRAFADRSNLRAHMQTHSDRRRYACTRCQKCFSLKSYLNKHYESACIRVSDVTAAVQK